MPPSHGALDVFLTGDFSLDSYLSSWRKRRETEAEEDATTERLLSLIRTSQQESMHTPQKKRKRRRTGTSAKMYVMDAATGNPRIGTPMDCVWWVNHVTHAENMTPRMHDKFRRRFRMPFDAWKEFVNTLNQNELFRPWHRGAKNCAGAPCSPIELLSLGALRYIGRKCTFDDLEEVTFISERTHQRFFKKIIQYGAEHLYPEHVIAPNNPEEARTHMHEMDMAGFNGGIGSMDATHVTIENCRYGLRQIHLGHKLSKTARTYNIIVNHCRRILSSTAGHPSRWNDKTLVLFDSFVEKIRSGEVLSDNEFVLFERVDGGTIVSVKYKGVWLLVDNGYLQWSCTIPPFKYCGDRSELRWSQWLESMRKDVECTFGILKKRFQILQKGVQAYDLEDADRVWMTCCALHNMLLDVDGLDELWEGEIPSDPSVGDTDTFAIERLLNGEDCSRLIRHEGERNLNWVSDVASSGIVRDVNKIQMNDMRKKLVEHFDILFHNGGIVWPRRAKRPRCS